MSDDSESTQEKTKKNLSFVQLAIAASAVVLVLLVYNFQNMHAYEDMAENVSEKMFASSDVEAVLLTYRDMGDLLQLKVNVKGISGELASYRSEALKFVCNDDELFRHLSGDNNIDLSVVMNTAATKRKDDKYLELTINSALCNGLR